MKYLFLLCLIGCTLNAKQNNTEQQKDSEFNRLINKANENHIKFIEVHKSAKEKQDKLVAQAISKIVSLNGEVKNLKSEIGEMKVKVDTVYIHDTIQIKEKKNFWGKTKVDTTNKE